MYFEFKIALRYLITKKREKFVSLISLISVAGVAIGVMALIVVLAVMSGFDQELKDKIVGSFAHITIESEEGIGEYEQLVADLGAFPHVEAASPYIQGQVLISVRNRLFPIGVRGVRLESEKKISKLKDYIVRGNFDNLRDNSCIIGGELSSYTGLGIGDELSVYSPFLKEKTHLAVAAVFNSGMYDYDFNLIFVNINTAQRLFGMENMVGGVAIKLDNLYLADKIKLDISRKVGFNYRVSSWMDRNRNFFAALKLEKTAMFIILALIVLVACFNIVSTLIVMVVEKTKDIGILRSIGASRKNIRRIFTLVGLFIGVSGTFLGSAAGILICFLLKRYHFLKLPADIYYIQTLPVHLKLWPDITAIVVSALLIIFLSTIYPAVKASKIIPAEALRYE